MGLLILELGWWALLFLFFWILRDTRGRLAAEPDPVVDNEPGTRSFPGAFQEPSALRQPIGTYLGTTIHRYAEFEGQTYQYDRVCPLEASASVSAEELYLAPGLVYRPMRTAHSLSC